MTARGVFFGIVVLEGLLLFLFTTWVTVDRSSKRRRLIEHIRTVSLVLWYVYSLMYVILAG